MSTINVDNILPQSGNNVEVNGVEVRGYNSSIKIGPAAGDNLGIYSIAIGTFALANSTGQSNTAIGFQASLNQTTGGGNTALGAFSLNQMTTGTQNTALGYYTLKNAVVSGGLNTAVGAQSLSDLTTGQRNTAIGQNSGSLLTTGGNNIIVGADAQASTDTISNEITLGNPLIDTLRCAVTSITSLSDARDKDNVKESPYGLDFVNLLKPVTFDWKTRDGSKIGIKDLGFIAQDLKEVDDENLNLVYEANPEKLEASYGRLIPVLVKAIQELSEEIKQLKSK
jgi:hypothetical protein